MEEAHGEAESYEDARREKEEMDHLILPSEGHVPNDLETSHKSLPFEGFTISQQCLSGE